jgi:hypothetical protein
MQFIYGMPTTGKSYAALRLRLLGQRVIDTDELVELLHPRFFKDKEWRKIGTPEGDARQRDVTQDVTNLLRRAKPGIDFVVTNFRDPGLFALSDLTPLGFVRDADGIEAEWRKRQAHKPEDLTPEVISMVRGWADAGSPDGTDSVVLPAGTYIWDFLSDTIENAR